jgi:ribosomal protein L7/L12
MPEADVLRIQQRLDYVEDQLLTLVPDYVSHAAKLDQEMPSEIVELARSGKKIAAIDAYRRHTGVGLREAKAVIDRL